MSSEEFREEDAEQSKNLKQKPSELDKYLEEKKIEEIFNELCVKCYEQKAENPTLCIAQHLSLKLFGMTLEERRVLKKKPKNPERNYLEVHQDLQILSTVQDPDPDAQEPAEQSALDDSSLSEPDDRDYRAVPNELQNGSDPDAREPVEEITLIDSTEPDDLRIVSTPNQAQTFAVTETLWFGQDEPMPNFSDSDDFITKEQIKKFRHKRKSIIADDDGETLSNVQDPDPDAQEPAEQSTLDISSLSEPDDRDYRAVQNELQNGSDPDAREPVEQITSIDSTEPDDLRIAVTETLWFGQVEPMPNFSDSDDCITKEQIKKLRHKKKSLIADDDGETMNTSSLKKKNKELKTLHIANASGSSSVKPDLTYFLF